MADELDEALVNMEGEEVEAVLKNIDRRYLDELADQSRVVRAFVEGRLPRKLVTQRRLEIQETIEEVKQLLEFGNNEREACLTIEENQVEYRFLPLDIQSRLAEPYYEVKRERGEFLEAAKIARRPYLDEGEILEDGDASAAELAYRSMLERGVFSYATRIAETHNLGEGKTAIGRALMGVGEETQLQSYVEQ